jgi:D-glycero-alpha-D-manno-heptose-7-phosphate kinase
MIISSAPLRVPIGGGGTDLPEFYEKQGSGQLVSCAINKFVYCLIRKNFELGIRFTGYHKKEIVSHYSELQNPLVRSVLKYLEFEDDIEIVSMSDVRTSCGLGTSSAFTVALIYALHHYKGNSVSSRDIAEQAVIVEREILNEAGGFQDQYVSSLGGGVKLVVDQSGTIEVDDLGVSKAVWDELFSYFVFFDTKVERRSFEIQERTVRRVRSDISANQNLTEILNIGLRIEDCIKNRNFLKIGDLFREHWKLKEMYSGGASSIFSEYLDEALLNGARGGKLMGAGGGGFFICFVDDADCKTKLIEYMSNQGFPEVSFNFYPYGVGLLSQTR